MTGIGQITSTWNQKLAALLLEQDRRLSRRKIDSYFPDTGPLRRELYPKHLEFFMAGASHRQRAAIAANRIGKSEAMGLYELVCHLTGAYPLWWKGRRFKHPVRAWAAGDTGKTVREILQHKLLGVPGAWGTGLIPGDSIHLRPDGQFHITKGSGVADSVDTIYVNHATEGVADGVSVCVLKSFEQGRIAFQGTEQHVILLDEECPMAIKTECVMRTMTTDGIIMQTFTPLLGMSEGVMDFLPDGDWQNLGSKGSKYALMAGWDDVPHLTEEAKREMLEAIPPFQRDARSKGIPQLGSGAIYPVPESEVLVDDFDPPPHWPRYYAMDVGWNVTAVGWYAIDRESDIIYRYSEHYRGQAEPAVHAEAIRARGDWIRGVIDPASRGRSQHDGLQLMQKYIDLGLHLDVADNSVEAGIYDVWSRLSSGRLKVMRRSSPKWLEEYRLYRRDERGRIVKDRDHGMDECRYGVRSGPAIARCKPGPTPEPGPRFRNEFGGASGAGWMGG